MVKNQLYSLKKNPLQFSNSCWRINIRNKVIITDKTPTAVGELVHDEKDSKKHIQTLFEGSQRADYNG